MGAIEDSRISNFGIEFRMADALAPADYRVARFSHITARNLLLAWSWVPAKVAGQQTWIMGADVGLKSSRLCLKLEKFLASSRRIETTCVGGWVS